MFRRRAGQASSSFRGNATFVDAASMTLRLTAPGKRPSSRLIRRYRSHDAAKRPTPWSEQQRDRRRSRVRRCGLWAC